MKGRRICIVGFSDMNRRWAAEQPRDVELWGLNEAHNCTVKLRTVDDLGRGHSVRCPCYNPNDCRCYEHPHEFMPRYDRWFQIHPPDWKQQDRIDKLAKMGHKLHPDDMEAFGRNERHVNFLKECDKPLYCLRPWRRFPSAVRYPFGKVEKALGMRWNGRKYLYATSSPSYMIALALYEHLEGNPVAEIRLAGIELALGTEYFWQRPCMEYYLGLATGWGIKVKRPPWGSSLLTAPRYAVDDPPPLPKDFTIEPKPIGAPSRERIEQADTPEIEMAEPVEEAVGAN